MRGFGSVSVEEVVFESVESHPANSKKVQRKIAVLMASLRFGPNTNRSQLFHAPTAEAPVLCRGLRNRASCVADMDQAKVDAGASGQLRPTWMPAVHREDCHGQFDLGRSHRLAGFAATVAIVNEIDLEMSFLVNSKSRRLKWRPVGTTETWAT